MIRKGCCVIAVVAVALALLPVCRFLLPPKEPVWGGRRLSAWLADLDGDTLEARARARDAIREIGTNALPFLIQRLRVPNRKRDSLDLKTRWGLIELLEKQSLVKLHIPLPHDPRHQALAAIDALAPAASGALPTLEGLLHENPPDTRALCVIARIGSAGVPVLLRALTNEQALVQISARVCLDMYNTSRPDILLPEPGSMEPNFDSRVVRLNGRVLAAAFQEYKRKHPEPFERAASWNRSSIAHPSRRVPGTSQS